MRILRVPVAIAGSAVLFGGCLESTTNTGDVVQPDTSAPDTVADGGEDAAPDVAADGGCFEPDDPSALVGQPCDADQDWTGFCADSNQLVVGCMGGTWMAGDQVGDPELPCECASWRVEPDHCGPMPFVCAVIGYAGISVAGFARHGGMSMRLV